jgi:DNA modification methylase
MGVGSTGVAALQVSRQFIGIEMAEIFYRVAVERTRNVCAQTF